MYKCENCGAVFTATEVPIHKEYHHELDGCPYETFIGNCSCGGDILEAEQCVVCDEYVFGDELVCGVCQSCREYFLTAENAIDFACKQENIKQEYNLNWLVPYLFTDVEINEILLRELQGLLSTKILPCELEDVINNDGEDAWAEYIKEKEKSYDTLEKAD